MNASQAALVNKFASEPLEQSEMWVGDKYFEQIPNYYFLHPKVTYYPGLEETAELMRNLRDYGLFRQDSQFKEIHK